MNAKLIQVNDEVKRIRKSLGLTQNEFANLLGVHTITVSQWETGRRMMNAEAYRSMLKVQKALAKATNKKEAAKVVRELEVLNNETKVLDSTVIDEWDALLKEARALGVDTNDYGPMEPKEMLDEIKDETQEIEIADVTRVIGFLLGQRAKFMNVEFNQYRETPYELYDDNFDPRVVLDACIAAAVAASISGKSYGVCYDFDRKQSKKVVFIAEAKESNAAYSFEPDDTLKVHVFWTGLNSSKSNDAVKIKIKYLDYLQITGEL